MITRILAVTAFSLSLGTAAIAQTSTDTTTSGTATTTPSVMMPANGISGGMPSWDSTISGAFFADTNAGTLKTEEDIKTGWASLSADQQAQVRTDWTASTTTDTTASGTTGATGTVDMAAQAIAMTQLCTWVQSL